MNDNLNFALRLYLQSSQFTQGLAGSTRGVNQFASNSTRAVSRLDAEIRKVRNQLAGLGLGFATVRTLRDSAQLDKSLTQIGQTVGASKTQVRALRGEIFTLSRDTGRPIDTLVTGFNDLVQSGLNFKEALATIKAINPASAVTGAGEDVLARGLSVASASYGFDLSQPKVAVDLLDQLTVAGRLGNAELGNLSDIFARVGVNAKSANLQFPQTLGFLEGLSQVERQPERLATLADSTLRLFTNSNYKKAASRATGVAFYNRDGSSRDPFDVLDAIAAKYRKLGTDRARDRFIAAAFGKADLDTQRGLKTLLAGDALKQVRSFTREISQASGTIARDLPDAIDNAVAQTQRLKTSFREVGDALALPVNKVLTNLIEFQLNARAQGGLGLGPAGTVATTGALALGAAGLAYGARGLLRRVPGIGPLLGGAVGTAAGVAQGKVLEAAAGVTPVFVTNFPDASGRSGGIADAVAGGAAALGVGKVLRGNAATLRLLRAATVSDLLGGTLGATGLALGAAGVGAAGLAGYGVGSLISKGIEGTALADKIGRAVAVALAAAGSADARAALEREKRTDVSGTIKIEVDPTTLQLKVRSAQRRGNVDFDFSSGPLALTGN